MHKVDEVREYIKSNYENLLEKEYIKPETNVIIFPFKNSIIHDIDDPISLRVRFDKKYPKQIQDIIFT